MGFLPSWASKNIRSAKTATSVDLAQLCCERLMSSAVTVTADQPAVAATSTHRDANRQARKPGVKRVLARHAHGDGLRAVGVMFQPLSD